MKFERFHFTPYLLHLLHKQTFLWHFENEKSFSCDKIWKHLLELLFWHGKMHILPNMYTLSSNMTWIWPWPWSFARNSWRIIYDSPFCEVCLWNIPKYMFILPPFQDVGFIVLARKLKHARGGNNYIIFEQNYLWDKGT